MMMLEVLSLWEEVVAAHLKDNHTNRHTSTGGMPAGTESAGLTGVGAEWALQVSHTLGNECDYAKREMSERAAIADG